MTHPDSSLEALLAGRADLEPVTRLIVVGAGCGAIIRHSCLSGVVSEGDELGDADC